jgi:hypothetical protein
MDGLKVQGSGQLNNQEPLIFENKIVPMWASTNVAAAILGITPNALRIRKFRGQIECRFFGNQLRFNVGYLQSLLRETREERKE